MVTIIKEPHTEYTKETKLEYRYRDDPDSGFTFTWKDGKVQLNPISEKNYKWCQEHPEEVECLGVVEIERKYRVPALVKCECGKEFYLNGHYYGCTQCPGCLKWYAVGGYEVLSPDQWRLEQEESQEE